MGLKKMFKNGDAKGSVRRRRAGKESGKDDDTDDEVENNCDKVGSPPQRLCDNLLIPCLSWSFLLTH